MGNNVKSRLYSTGHDAVVSETSIRRAATESEHGRLMIAIAVLFVLFFAENLIRIDCVTESPNVNGDDRAALLLADPARLAVQVEEPT